MTGKAHGQGEFFIDRDGQFTLERDGSKNCLCRCFFEVIGELISHDHRLSVVQSRDFIQGIRVAKKYNDALATPTQNVHGFEVTFRETVFRSWADVLQVYPNYKDIVVLSRFLYV